MKTKEQLKDIKLFADFIDIKLIQEWEDCTDTKTSIHINWIIELSTDLVLGRFVYKEFNPEKDWNLLMKCYDKMREIPDEYHDKFQHCLDRVQAYILESDNETVYDELLFFIKLYNQINTNSNNNQS